MISLFVSDLHGKTDKYLKLFNLIKEERPKLVFLGGDLLPHSYLHSNFIKDFLIENLQQLKLTMQNEYPRIFLILGNDDAKAEEKEIIKYSSKGIWEYVNLRSIDLTKFKIYGYCYTPPSPFLLKDWEKYDVSRFVDPGCISPEDGKRTVEISDDEKKYSTIKKDLEILFGKNNINNDIILFHGPPYKTKLDRSALDGKMIDHTPLDVHVGSVAIRKLIEEKQPKLTLHGHIHESARLTGSWKDQIGNTLCLSAAHDGNELALIKFDFNNLTNTQRILI
ncbi:MAG: metallophosphoesterase [Melioribacteraceae bacterium]|nr:metallophosphoesterase [Melioribacteraceae bacterium]